MVNIFLPSFAAIAIFTAEFNIGHLKLGQVHRAKLRGKEVVVKVQRPGLKALFDIDLKNLRVSTFKALVIVLLLICFS